MVSNVKNLPNKEILSKPDIKVMENESAKEAKVSCCVCLGSKKNAEASESTIYFSQGRWVTNNHKRHLERFHVVDGSKKSQSKKNESCTHGKTVTIATLFEKCPTRAPGGASTSKRDQGGSPQASSSSEIQSGFPQASSSSEIMVVEVNPSEVLPGITSENQGEDPLGSELPCDDPLSDDDVVSYMRRKVTAVVLPDSDKDNENGICQENTTNFQRLEDHRGQSSSK